MLLFTPPEGQYDTPFIFVFDATSLSNGQDAPNQRIDMDPGIGDFICRRVAGLQSVVNPVGGRFQMKDDLLRSLQSFPVYANGTDEIAIPDGVFYSKTGAIRFDLYDILIAV